jgi:predicted HicB family RNase H-like nuclease
MVVRRKTAPLNIYVSPELKAAAMRAAKADQRSLTSLVEKLLTDYCRETGYLPREASPARKGKSQ